MYISSWVVYLILLVLVAGIVYALITLIPRHITRLRRSKWYVPLAAAAYVMELPPEAEEAVHQTFLAKSAVVRHKENDASYDFWIRGNVSIAHDSISAKCWMENRFGQTVLCITEDFSGDLSFDRFASRLAEEIVQYMTDAAIISTMKRKPVPESPNVITSIQGFISPFR